MYERNDEAEIIEHPRILECSSGMTRFPRKIQILRKPTHKRQLRHLSRETPESLELHDVIRFFCHVADVPAV